MDMKITFPGGKRVNAEYNGHIIKTDQTIPNSGHGSAPEPFDLFLASIGTCAGIYVLGFCQQRGIDTTDLELIQTMNYSPDMRFITYIGLDIKLPAGFPEKYKSAIIKSAQLCKVKRHLEQSPTFDVRTVN